MFQLCDDLIAVFLQLPAARFIQRASDDDWESAEISFYVVSSPRFIKLSS